MRQVILILIWFTSVSASADGDAHFLVFPTLTIHQETGVVGGSSSSVITDLRFGYGGSAWYFGMMYSRTTSAGPIGINQSAFGNSVGYFWGPVSAIGTIYLLGNLDETSNSASPLHRDVGTGIQIDVSYLFPVDSNLSIGPTLSYKNMTYRSEMQNGVIVNNTNNEGFFFPFIGLLYAF